MLWRDGGILVTDLVGYVDVPWPSLVCPPGFVVDAAAQPTAPGVAACKADSGACGDDPYGDAALVDAPDRVFVDAGKGSATGTGTRAKPYATLSQALATASAGGTVLLAAGAYSGAVLAKSVALRGRCAAMVTLSGAAGGPTIAVTATSGIVALRGMHLTGPGDGIEASGAAALHLQDLWISGVRRVGVMVAGGPGKVERVVIDGILPQTGTNALGWGLGAQSGAVQLTDVRLSAVRHVGLVANGPNVQIDAARLLVAGVAVQASDQAGGIGISVSKGALVTLNQARVTTTAASALAANGAAARLQGVDVLADNIGPAQASATTGRGISAVASAQISLDRVRISQCRGAAVFATGKGTVVALDRLLADGQADRSGDRGVSFQAGAQVKLADGRFTGHIGAGVVGLGPGIVLAMNRVVIDHTAGAPGSEGIGRGIDLRGGGTAVLDRVRLSANTDTGLRAYDLGTEVTATRLLIDGTLGRADGRFGRGLDLIAGAQLDLHQAQLHRNASGGALMAGTGTRCKAEDLMVSETLPQSSDQLQGTGVEVQDGARLDVLRGRVHGNHKFGVVAGGAGAALWLRQMLVDSTKKQLAGTEFGRGIGVQSGAELHAFGVRLARNRDISAAALAAGPFELVGVRVADTAPDSKDQFGVGLWIEGNATPAVLAACKVTGGRSAAIALRQAAADISDSAIAGVQVALYPQSTDPDQAMRSWIKHAEGLVLQSVGPTQVRRVVIGEVERAAVLATNAAGCKLSAVRGHGAAYGLALATAGPPQLEGCAWLGGEQAVAQGAGLFVPPAPVLGSLGLMGP